MIPDSSYPDATVFGPQYLPSYPARVGIVLEHCRCGCAWYSARGSRFCWFCHPAQAEKAAAA